jgi:hypothetical protein
MLRFYKVFLGEQFVGLYRGFSVKEAIDQAYMQHGSASRYTGNGKDAFTAVPV